MPRKPKIPGAPVDPRGGPRSGTPGRRYAQRSDLAAQPVRTATGQAYGQAGQQAAAQRAVPLAQMPDPASLSYGAGHADPGSLGDFARPTDRPLEPLTAGVPMGPGPGPEALNLGAGAQANLESLLDSLARQPGATSDVAWLASFLRSGRR